MLPGQTTSVEVNDPWGTECCSCDQPATVKMCTEADSFGEEFEVYCQPCYDVYKKAQEEAEETSESPCDSCRGTFLTATMHYYRNIDEGSHGPVYHVCEKCYQKYQDYISRECGNDEDY